jgi:regulator of sigma E protease
VGVEKFSLGFGPRVLWKKVGMTEYRISAIPLGGYVKMVGEAPDSELEPSQVSLSFSHKSLWKRSLIVLAGPVSNILLAVVVFSLFLQIAGLPILEPEVGEVKEGMPAHEAGIGSGDRIISVNDTPVTQWEGMARLIKASEGQPIDLEILRDESVISIRIVPELMPSQNQFGEAVEKYVIGIAASGAYTVESLKPIASVTRGVSETWQIAKVTVVVIGKILTGSVAAKEAIGGPIMIAQIAGEYAKTGLASLIRFIAVLSVTLGIINLLPIPVLDGGHLLFFLIEGVKGKPLNIRVREIAQQVGLFILILIMIYVIYNDISRILFD